MAILKCKMCGGDIEVNEEKTFGTCEYCGSVMTLPKVSDDQRAARFNRGNHFRRQGEFDKALAVYESVVREDDADAEAHWCCALCRFGIEYVEDPNTYEYLPTCHRASFDSFLADVDYLAALENSDGITKRQYQKDAAKIAEVQRGILATSQNEEPFDVFICYKETDDSTKERTRDSLDAQDIYYQLTQEGYRVFFSRITLEDKVGTEYEPYIFAALNSAKVMIAIGSKPEYFNAVWVKNEWSRFLAMMRKDRSKLLLPCYKDMDPYDLPEQLGVLQSYDMAKIGFMQDLIRGIKKVLRKDEPKQTAKETVVVNSGAANVAPLLKRGMLALEDGEWDKANGFFDQALNNDAECADAYVGFLMAELQVRRREDLKNQKQPFDSNNNFQKAIRFGDDKTKDELNGYITQINMRNKNETYDCAVIAMNEAETEKAYEEAAGMFSDISGWKDADALEEQCRKEAWAAHRREEKEETKRLEEERKKQVYADATALMNKAKTIDDYNDAIISFSSICTFSDSKKKIDECQKRIMQIRLAKVQKNEERYRAFQKFIELKSKIEFLGYKAEQEFLISKKRELENELSRLGRFAFSRKKEIPEELEKIENRLKIVQEALDWIIAKLKAYNIDIKISGDAGAQNELLKAKAELQQNENKLWQSSAIREENTPYGKRKGSILFLNGGTVNNGVLSSNKGLKDYLQKNHIECLGIPDCATSICDNAFSECESLIYVILPVSIKSIGESAFFLCKSLTSIFIPAGVESIGDGAFDCCDSLTKISVDPLNKTFDSRDNCNGIIKSAENELVIGCSSTVIPEGVVSIGILAFRRNYNLTSITIPDSVTRIGREAFSNCTNLTSITIPGSVTSIGWGVFKNCSSLKNITIPAGLSSIEDSMFMDCICLKNITISDGVKSIGEHAFLRCSSLTSVTIPDSVTSIGESAFSNCTNLTSVTIPDSVISIGESAFENCGNLTSVTIPAGVTRISNHTFERCYYLESATIPDSVTSIGEAAFLGCGNLTSVTIPDSVTSIGESAFSNCTNLTSISIPGSVINIGESAFSFCGNFTNVTISDGVTSIGNYAFSNCENLTSVTIPDSVTSIGKSAFLDCRNLTSVTIPAGVTRISNHTFERCYYLESATIPDSVTSIGENAFLECLHLKSVTIPDSVTSIEACAFWGCVAIENLEIPDSVTDIGFQAFWPLQQ